MRASTRQQTLARTGDIRPLALVLAVVCLGAASHGSACAQETIAREFPADSADRWIPNLPRMQIDEARVRAAGIRRLAGKRLVLYTDMPASPAVEELPETFDRAFPQWCEYFDTDPGKHTDWQMTGFLMRDKARFQQTGLLPRELPPFQHGFSRNFELWLYEQPTDYYRRHLLLHEGTHGFMNTTLGGCGPPWYMEGIAELLATHHWEAGRLALNYVPVSRDDARGWGRVRMIKDALKDGRAMELGDVLKFSPQAHLENEPYAWCWAAALLLDRHPGYRQRFRQLQRHVLAPDFNRRFIRALGDDGPQLGEQWRLMIANLEYGYDVKRTAVDFTPGAPLPPEGTVVAVAADRGWQNSGARLQAGAAYRLRAAGRYQVGDRPQTWWSEPGGVSLRYYQGRPLGMLLAAVRPDRPAPGSTPLLNATAVGLGTRLVPSQTGTLYLKINDSAGELGDNVGELKMQVVPE